MSIRRSRPRLPLIREWWRAEEPRSSFPNSDATSDRGSRPLRDRAARPDLAERVIRHHRLVALVQDGHAGADRSAVRLGRGPAHLDDLTGGAERVAWSNHLPPAQFVDPDSDDGCIAVTAGFDEEPHGQRSDLPTAGDDPAERPIPGRVRVDMDRLRIVCPGVGDQLVLADHDRSALPDFPFAKILEVLRHRTSRSRTHRRTPLLPRPPYGCSTV